MQNFTCEKCKGTWSFKDILPIVLQYGFVNLVSCDDELIAFPCPGNDCNSLIIHKTKAGHSKDFHMRLAGEIDPSGYESLNAQFKYLSSFQLSTKCQEILTSFEVQEENWSIWEYENDLIPERGEVYNDLYCSFNELCLSSYGNQIRIWWYRKKDINKLFDIERISQLRIFPRYVRHTDLLEKINTFYSIQYLQEADPSDPKKDSSSAIIDSWDKGKIARQYTFLELLTPPRDEWDLFVPRDDRLITYHKESNSIWKHFHQKYIQEQLASQSELFIRDFLDLYAKTNFCFPEVESLVSRYRSKISAGLQSRRKREAIQSHTLRELISQVQKEAPEFRHIISEDDDMLRLQLKLYRLVKNNTKSFPILLTGETGTGKTFLAKAIHNASGRKGEFVKVNAAAIATSIFESELFGHKKGAFSGAASDRKGLFQAADGGTLFLDEIGEIDLSLQVKLLTAIDEGVVMPLGSSVPVNVNVLMLFATNKNLEKAVEDGKFRQDLYYRINRFTYTIPPLQKRKNDIPLLAYHFVKKHLVKDDNKSPMIRISEDAQKRLLACKWPGNTRQLESVIESILMLRNPGDRSAISVDEVAEQLSGNMSVENCSINGGNLSATTNQTDFDADFDNIPDVRPAPGKRKMPDKDGIEKLLAYFFAKKGRKYGVIKETASHIGVDQTNLSREIKKLDIKFPET